MDKVNQIVTNEAYQKYLSKIELFERDRVFCKHDMAHFLDVARIGYIRNFELELKYDKSVIYGFAFLHDIGRWCEYENGEAHELAGVRLASEILAETDYRDYEVKMIIDAIQDHRGDEWDLEHEFSSLMYKADKASRACHSCMAKSECNWSDEKKNLRIDI